MKPLNVLIVDDDDPNYVRAIEMALTENGYTMRHAHTGRHGFPPACRQPPGRASRHLPGRVSTG